MVRLRVNGEQREIEIEPRRTLLAALRQRSGDRAAANAALTAARARFQQIGERRGLDAIADLDRQGAVAGDGRVKPVQSLRP